MTDGIESVKEYVNSRIDTLEANFNKKMEELLAAVNKVKEAEAEEDEE